MATVTINENYSLRPAFRGPPEQFHPDQVAPDSGNPAIEAVRGYLKMLWDGSVAVNNLRSNASPLDTPAAHNRKVVRAADELAKRSHSFDSVKAQLHSELKRLDGQMDTEAGLKANPRYEAAILLAFSRMKPADQAAEIAKLIANGDTATLASLIEAPSVISGVDPEVRAGIRERVVQARCPMLLDMRRKLTAAEDKLENAQIRSMSLWGQLKAGTDTYEKKVAEAEAVARTAGFADN